jgi:hypothetical protein
MQNLIKTTIYLIVSLLLLSCEFNDTDKGKNPAPEDATTSKNKIATYYTFVMYKAPNDSSQWELPSNHEAIPGSYRFQIVYMNPYQETYNQKWMVLRGEFDFKKHGNGIQLKNIYTLDKTSKKEELYKKILKLMKPLYEEERKITKFGTGIPNFIRFLVRQTNGVKYTWNDKNKQYHIYRLHYLKDQLRQEKQIEIISRFINPKQAPTTDINELKKLLDDNENFKLAEYLGKPDNRHINFYKNFKAWFNDWHLYIKKEDNQAGNQGSGGNNGGSGDINWTSIILAILFVIIIAIISIAFYFQDKLKLLYIKYKKTDYEFGDNYSDNEKTQPAAYLNINEDNRESAFDNVSINEFNKLKKDLQQEIRDELITAKNDLQISSHHTQATPEIDYNQFSPLVEMAVKKYLDKNLGSYLNLHLKADKNQMTPAKKNQQAVKTSSDNRNYTQKDIPPTIPKQLEKPTDNTIIQIKTLLLSNKSVDDEAALNSLNTNVDPFMFITSVVGNCLKLNQPLTHYQRLNDAIKNITNNKVSLLIPNVGDDVNTVEHNVVGQQTVTKGKLNVVASFSRPGVKCDGVIKRKAEVVQNV